MEFKFKATPMPRRPLTTSKIMLRLCIGLMIVYAYGLFQSYRYGINYLINGILLLLVSEAVSYACEAVYALMIKDKILNIFKTSFPYITPLILVLTVPVNTSLYVMGISTLLAVVFGKLVFGGFGQNIFNPAAVGRAIIATSFAGVVALDAISSPTVTTVVANASWVTDPGSFYYMLKDFGGLGSVVTGNYFGALGETNTLLIIIVGILLSVFDVIDYRIPLTYLGVMFLGATAIALLSGLGIDYPITFVSTGGAAFAAVFMLTDPVTNPQTRPGKIVFSALAALFTIAIRFLGNLPEGVVFSILLVNMLSPTINRIFANKQVDSIKRNIIITFGTVVVSILILTIIGTSVEKGTYKENTFKPFDPNAETGLAADDYSDCGAVVTDLGNGKYHVSVHGFTALNYEGADNEYDIEIKDGKVVSIECTKFSDTQGIGDAAITAEALSDLQGISLSDEVDTMSGCTFTSRSVVAAIQAALKEAK